MLLPGKHRLGLSIQVKWCLSTSNEAGHINIMKPGQVSGKTLRYSLSSWMEETIEIQSGQNISSKHACSSSTCVAHKSMVSVYNVQTLSVGFYHLILHLVQQRKHRSCKVNKVQEAINILSA